MKKQIKSAAAIALAMSAITPVAAFAADAQATVAPGLYTSNSFTDFNSFKAKTAKEKGRALIDPSSVLVFPNGSTIKGSLIVSATDAELTAATYSTAAAYAAANNVEFSPTGVKAPGQNQGELKVESVSAINAAQVAVKFSKALTAEEEAIFVDGNGDLESGSVAISALTTGTNNSVTLSGATASVSADGKTLTVTLAAGEYLEGNYSITVDTDDVNPYASTFTVKDTTKAKIASVTSKAKSTTGTSATIVFSEPVVAGSVVKVNGVAAGVTVNDSRVTVSDLELDASKTHTVEVVNLEDAAGNVEAIATATFKVEVDANAPTVTNIAAYGDNAILVTFDKKVTTASLNSGKVKAIDATTFDAIALSSAVPATAGATSSDSQFIIPVSDSLFEEKTSRNLSLMFSEGILDTLGNESGAVSKTVKLTQDTTGPSVTGISVKNDKVTIKFSEGLAGQDPAESVIKVIDPEGEDVTASFFDDNTSINTFAKEVVLTVDSTAYSALEAGKYTVIIGKNFVTDASEAANSNVAYTGQVDFGIEASPNDFEIDPADVASSDDNTNVITVDFEQAVKGGSIAGSATDVNNYTLGGKPLPAGTVITLDSAKEVATITIPEGTITKTDEAAIFTIRNVQSATGITVTPFTTTLQATDNVQPELTVAKVNTDGTLSLTFSEKVTTGVGAEADFVITLNDIVLDPSAYTIADGVGADAGKYVITVATSVQNVAVVDIDGTEKNILYIDADGDSSYTAGDDILVDSAVAVANTAGDANANAYTAGTYNLTKALKLKVGTASSTTVTDSAANDLKASKTITVK